MFTKKQVYIIDEECHGSIGVATSPLSAVNWLIFFCKQCLCIGKLTDGFYPVFAQCFRLFHKTVHLHNIFSHRHRYPAD